MITKEQFASMQDHYLSHADKVTACHLVVESGADYIKQSTGTTPE